MPKCLFQSASLLALSLGGIPLIALPAAAQSFADTQTHWGKDCVNDLGQQLRVRGYPDGTFRPEGRLTRAEYAVLMLNSFPEDQQAIASRSIPSFRDLPAKHWAYNALRSAYRRGILVGYPDRSMRPDQSVSRAEAIAILYKLASPVTNSGDLRLDDIPPFPIPPKPERVLAELFEDAAEAPEWARPSLAGAAAGFMVVDYPSGKRLRASQPTTRAEAAAFLCQASQRDGLVPLEAVAGYSQFAQSLELNKLWQLQTLGQQRRFDTQQERTVTFAPPSGWQLGEIGKVAENRIAAQFYGLDGVTAGGFYDQNGQLVIPPNFSTTGDFSEGLAWVQQLGRYGFIDGSGKVEIPLTFDSVEPFSEGLAAVKVGELIGFIDKTGKMVIVPQRYNSVSPFSEGLAVIGVLQENTGRSLYGFIDRTGKVVIEPQFASADAFSAGLAAVHKTPEDISSTPAKTSYINQRGQRVLEEIRGDGSRFSEGLAAIRITELEIDPVSSRGYTTTYGYIDTAGQWAIAPQTFFGEPADFFWSAGAFKGGVAPVRIGDRFGFIDRQGELVVKPVFSDVQEISDGYAHVNYGGVRVSYVGGYDGNATPITEIILRGGRWGYIKLPEPSNGR